MKDAKYMPQVMLQTAEMSPLKYDDITKKHLTMKFTVKRIDFINSITNTTHLRVKECTSYVYSSSTYYCPESLDGVILEGDMDSNITS
jgi:hypothetical protein